MVVIYGRPNCVYCEKARELCVDYKLDYEYRNIVNDVFKSELKEKVPDAKTVPQIWMGDRYIGGYTEFASEIENTIGGYGEGPV